MGTAPSKKKVIPAGGNGVTAKGSAVTMTSESTAAGSQAGDQPAAWKQTKAGAVWTLASTPPGGKAGTAGADGASASRPPDGASAAAGSTGTGGLSNAAVGSDSKSRPDASAATGGGSNDEGEWNEMLAGGQADTMMVHSGGLHGLKIRRDSKAKESDSDDDDDDVGEGEEAGGNWLEQEELDLEDLKKQYNSQLLDPEINQYLVREDAVKGFKLRAHSGVAGSSDEEDGSDSGSEVMDDWLDGDADAGDEEALNAEEEEIAVAVSDLFEESTWTYKEALRNVFGKAGLDDDQQEKIMGMLEMSHYEPGEYIVRQGEMGDKFFIITEGEVIVTRNDETAPDGEAVITHLYQGHFFGETSLATEAPRNANVRAVHERVTCMYLTKDLFTPLLKESDSFRRMIDELVLKKVETAKKRAELGKHRTGAAPEAKRNDVKISKLNRYGRTKDKNLVINDYVVVHKLGSGSFGQVFLALCLSNGKAYAMKIVDRAMFRRKTLKSDDEMLKEVAVMKRLQHNNVVSLYEVIDDPGHEKFYLVQEYLKNGPVMDDDSEVVEPLSVEMARKYFRHLLQGLDYLHFQGVVHRDIKPANVLLAQDGTCKIGDFGASALPPGDDDTLPANDVQGTPAFMAPELFKEGLKSYHGFRVDMWAMGCTLYQFVVGVPPFLANTEMQLVELVQTSEPKVSPVVAANPGLKNLLARLLDKNPDTRLTLGEACAHDWVTDEGTEPLVLQNHTRLRLRSTAVAFDSAGVGSAASSGGAGAPAAVPEVGEEGSDLVGDLPAAKPSVASDGADIPAANRVDSVRDLVPELPSPPPKNVARGLGTDDTGHEMSLDGDVIPVADSDLHSDAGSARGGRRGSQPDSRRGSADARAVSSGRGRRGTAPDGAFRPKFSMSIGNIGAVSNKGVTAPNYAEAMARAKQLKSLKAALDTQSEGLTDADKDKLLDRLRLEPMTMVDPTRAEVIVSLSEPDASGSSEGEDVATGIAPARGASLSESYKDQAGATAITHAVSAPDTIVTDATSPAARDAAAAAAATDGDRASVTSEASGTTGTTPRRVLSNKQSLARMGSLRRQPDFLLVQETFESGKKAVIIRSKSGRSFSSLTSGSDAGKQVKAAGTPGRAAAVGNLGRRPKVLARPSDSDSDDDEEVVVATVGGSGGAGTTPKGPKGGLLGLASTKPKGGGVSPIQSEGDSSDDDDDDDASEVVETLDDMVGEGAITHNLNDVFNELMEAPDDGDTMLLELDTEEEAKWMEVRFKLDNADSGVNSVIGFVVGHAEAQGDRASMEDRSAYFPDLARALKAEGAEVPAGMPSTGYFGVYDGHNGDGVSEFLLQRLHLCIAKHPAFASADPTPAIIAGCLEADGEIVKMNSPDIKDKSGSTANVLVVRSNGADEPPVLYCGNVGDSRCVLSRGGCALELSVDHRPDRADEKKRVEEAGGLIIQHRLNGVLAVTRSFGDVEHKGLHKDKELGPGEPLIAEPEIAQETLLAEDEFAVIACDGVWDVLSSQQVVNFVRRTLMADNNIQRAAEAVIAKALAMHSIDNCSCEVVAFHQPTSGARPK